MTAKLHGWRISKYDPADRGKNEWTAYSDIGRVFGGRTLMMEEYRRVENAYIRTILAAADAAGQKNLRVESLEVEAHDVTAITNGMLLRRDGGELEDVIRRNLREELWCRLEGEQFTVTFGYDYYVHLYTLLPRETVAACAEAEGLYAEPLPPVYAEEKI